MNSALVVHIYHNPTGARLFAAPMVQRLNQEGVRSELWCDGGTCTWFGTKAVTASEVPTRHLPCDLSLNPIRCLIRLIRLIVWFELTRPTVVHAHLLRSALLPLLAAWIVGIPKRVYHNHGLSHFGYRGATRWLLRVLERGNRAAATNLLLVSRSNLASALADGLGQNGTVLAYGSAVGVDIRRFSEPHVGPVVRQAGRSRLGIPAHVMVFGYAGRAVAHKGLDVLAQAWEHSHLAERGAVILLAGVRETELQALTGSIPIGMRCLGPLDEMPGFYAMCDCMVLSSHYEGFGYALLEGAAAGLPGIGSYVSGIRCAIVDGVTGLLVPPDDPTVLAAAMIRLADDPVLRVKLGNAARARVHASFSQELVLAALVTYYRDELRMVAGDTP